MKKPRLTLSQLAHFDRCIYPQSFRDDLVSRGVEGWSADMVARLIQESGNKMGIVEIAHRLRKFPKETEVINEMLCEWNEKFPDREDGED